jgi:hypothetical protein
MERAIDYRRLLGAALVNREFAGVRAPKQQGSGSHPLSRRRRSHRRKRGRIIEPQQNLLAHNA